MKNNHESVEKLLKEIVAASRATQGGPIDTPDHIKHLRYQIARLVRVCIEMNHRIDELEEIQEKHQMAGHPKGRGEEIELVKEEPEGQITAVGDLW